MSEERVRVLIAKPGLDGHDRGAKVVARGLRDAGFEVVYTGLHRTPAEIAEAALQEDVHAVGLSVLSGAHNRLLPEVVKELHQRELTDVLVVVGGIIPEDDVAALEEAGVSRVFPPGSAVGDIADFIRKNHPQRW
ncbi:MAG: cobalamin B12-binding domain-containing protein [Myxococcota bacterium]|nr:cobalamin B12-binding domain-containing protein [Myxococcota bacterium]